MRIQVECDTSSTPNNWVDKGKYSYIIMVDKLNSSIQVDKQKKTGSIDKKKLILCSFLKKQATGNRKHATSNN